MIVARGSVAWSESMICAHAIASPCKQDFRMPLRFASRLSSTDLIAPLRFYALLRRNKYIYIPLHASLPRRQSTKIWKTKGRGAKLRATFRGSPHPRGEMLLTRLVQLCAFPPPPSLEQIERDCLEKQKIALCSRLETRNQATMLRCSWMDGNCFRFYLHFFFFFWWNSISKVVIETERDLFLQFVCIVNTYVDSWNKFFS